VPLWYEKGGEELLVDEGEEGGDGDEPQKFFCSKGVERLRTNFEFCLDPEFVDEGWENGE